MNRRAFIGTLAGGLLAAPLAAEAQQAAKPKAGYLSASSPSIDGHRRKAFSEGLRDLGWVEGRNILVEERWAEGKYDRLQGLIAELVGLKVDVIVAAGPTPVIRAAKQATSTIPIVMAMGMIPWATASSQAFSGLEGTSPEWPGTRTRQSPRNILSF